MSDPNTNRGFFQWLGRQFGHVKKAINTDVSTKKVYRSQSTEEKPLLDSPEVTLRRTTIDEVIVRRPQRPTDED
jgi:hypothetical protein